MRDGGLFGTFVEDVQDGLVRQVPHYHPTGLIDVAEQRSRLGSSNCDPVRQGISGPVRCVAKTVLSSLAAHHEFTRFGIVIGEVQAHCFGAAESGAVQDGDQGRVAASGWTGVERTCPHQSRKFARGQRAATRQCLGLDTGHVGTPLEGFGVHQSKPESLMQHASQSRQHLVGRGGPVALC
jgi:hypothetical protein